MRCKLNDNVDGPLVRAASVKKCCSLIECQHQPIWLWLADPAGYLTESGTMVTLNALSARRTEWPLFLLPVERTIYTWFLSCFLKFKGTEKIGGKLNELNELMNPGWNRERHFGMVRAKGEDLMLPSKSSLINCTCVWEWTADFK